MVPVIDNGLCVACGPCVDACPNDVLGVDGDGSCNVVAGENCTGCGACELSCPIGAVFGIVPR